MADNVDQVTLGRRSRTDALQQGARKRPTTNDPLVHHGRHFGQAVYAFCSVRSLVQNGILRMSEENQAPEDLPIKERQEEQVFQQLLRMCPGLRDRLLDSSAEEVEFVADLIQKGANGSRADDTKSLKAAVVDWITPEGQTLNPPLSRKSKADRGFNHERTGALLCPAGVDWGNTQIKQKLREGEMQVRGDQWPFFLYADLAYDPEDPWNGLLRSHLLILAYKHVFTSPSSVDADEPKATRSGNARIHGMTSVTRASIAYISTQVRFALSSASVFSRTDLATDSERFYQSIFNILHDPYEQQEVNELLAWWNRKIFPHARQESLVEPIEGSALDRIRQKRAEKLAREASRSALVSFSSACLQLYLTATSSSARQTS